MKCSVCGHKCKRGYSKKLLSLQGDKTVCVGPQL